MSEGMRVVSEGEDLSNRVTALEQRVTALEEEVRTLRLRVFSLEVDDEPPPRPLTDLERARFDELRRRLDLPDPQNAAPAGHGHRVEEMPHVGPRGGIGRRDVQTGRVVYEASGQDGQNTVTEIPNGP